MNTHFSFLYSTLRSTILLLFISLFFFSCKKDDKKDEPAPVTPVADSTGTLAFHIHSQFSGKDIRNDTTYTFADGRAIRFQTAQFFISNISLIKDDGTASPVTLTDKVLLVSPSKQHQEVGVVKGGKYKGFSFTVGIADSAINHGNPAAYGADHPLSATQSPKMHWSWNSGYIFMRIDARVDSTGGATLNADASYHIGLLKFAKPILSYQTKAFTVNKDKETMLHFALDYAEVLKNIDFRTERKTHSMNNMPLAQKVVDNLPAAFKAEDHHH